MIKRYKKRIIIISIIILSVISTLIIASLISSLTPTSEENLEILVGQYDNPPKIFEDDNGKVVGLFPDLLEYVAEKEGWTIKYLKGSWTECLERLERKDIDIMVDVAYSDSRAEIYDFNNIEIFTNWGVVYGKEGSHIESLKDLEKKKVAVMKGSIHTDGEDGIKNVTQKLGINCTFIELENYDLVFEMLSEGGADAGIVNRLFGISKESEYNIKRTAIIFNPRKLMFAFPKGENKSDILISKIDEHLLLLKEDSDSFYFKVIDKYIYNQVYLNIPGWIIPTLISSIGLLVTFASASLLLKKAVDKRTDQLQHAHDNLERRVTKRTEELNEANIRLKELDRLKSMFLASMSHELRTPLNSIIGFSGWLLMDMEGELNEEQRTQLGMVKQSANHLLELINDILDISKIEAGKVDLEIEAFDLSVVLNTQLDSVLPLIREKELEIMREIPENLIIRCDKRRIKQIFVNLLANAIKFTDHGFIKVAVKPLNKTHLKISVLDSGIGMLTSDIHKLFIPFQQIDMSSTKKHEGTGLGLYLCKKLLNLLHGEIFVTSNFGQGSEFTFTIPLNYEEEVKK
ncbi:Sensor histidine kinase RcsC [Candidatus Lokiarchaeum ossiferum]|uniref:histidine kinase n=1 Tax=Candidatus Lokiarchaeum ossiferum TaxID=2951803 RepID=A0ABY6HXK6_9ARCH|nr:Sensor histidine kinase RcsC [Candidatus Lokiarchaeum sp. B-35]